MTRLSKQYISSTPRVEIELNGSDFKLLIHFSQVVFGSRGEEKEKVWGLTICLWLGPPWFNYWFSFTLAYSRISHEYSSLFIIVINLIFMFSL